MRSSFRVIIYTSPEPEDEADPMVPVINEISGNVQKMIDRNKTQMNEIIKGRIQKTQTKLMTHIDKAISNLELTLIEKIEELK